MSTGKLAAAICAVIQAVETVPKNGWNNFHKYNFSTEADILRAVREAMVANGLALVPSGIQHLGSAQFGQKGRFRTEFLVTYTLMHTSGASQTITVIAAGVDAEDKGPYKGMTGAQKYALRQTFLIPTGDDPEKDGPPAQQQRQQRPPPQRQQPQRQQRQDNRGQGNPHENQWRNNQGAAPSCPACGSQLWDNCAKRAGGWNGPAWKCKDRNCTGNEGEPWLQWDARPTPGQPTPQDFDPPGDEEPPMWDRPQPDDREHF